jgi:hypothetical protein
VQKHQDNIFSFLKLVTPGVPVSDAKIKQLRANNVALMTAATIRVQQAGGTRFSLKCLYEIARSEEKEAWRMFNKAAPAPESLATVLKDSATVMSSITDSDGYTTMSHCSGSSTSPPKICPQRRSPLRSSENDGTRKNPFNDKFLTMFPTMFLDSSANRTAPDEVVTIISKKSTPGLAGMETKLGIVTALSADGKKLMRNQRCA